MKPGFSKPPTTVYWGNTLCYALLPRQLFKSI